MEAGCVLDLGTPPPANVPEVGSLLWWVEYADRPVPQPEPVQVEVLAVEGKRVCVRKPNGVLTWEPWGSGGRYRLRKKKPSQCPMCQRWGGHMTTCEKRRDGL